MNLPWNACSYQKEKFLLPGNHDIKKDVLKKDQHLRLLLVLVSGYQRFPKHQANQTERLIVWKGCERGNEPDALSPPCHPHEEIIHFPTKTNENQKTEKAKDCNNKSKHEQYYR
jgi:hypothetical protein